MKYNYAEIEKKWQKKWDEEKTFKASNDDLTKPKFYALVEECKPDAYKNKYESENKPYCPVLHNFKQRDGHSGCNQKN